jgi:uncharacterized protein
MKIINTNFDNIKINELDSIYNSTKDPSWIQTFTLKKFFPLKPRSEDICIEDIAHALSLQCRFSGHINEFYSVANHSVLVSYICDSKDALFGLLHDASEAYLVDIPKPLKDSGSFEEYKRAENLLQTIIYNKYCQDSEEPISVKEADKILLATEARDLFSGFHPDWNMPIKPLPFIIKPMSPKEAEKAFLERFKELNEKR